MSATAVERRVLVVEDEPDIRASIKDLLEMGIEGCKVHLAANGPEGLRMLQEVRPHLIITDFKMPGMSGLEFLAAARAVFPETPRILMTAFPDIELATRAINEAHIENFLPKPVDPAEMVAKVQRVLDMEAARHEKERSLARTLRLLQETLDARKE